MLNKDLFVKKSITNITLDQNAPANPCGMIAYTLFNDSFALNMGALSIFISDQGIAWPSDLKKYVASNPSVMWTDITSERFMNWMRIAAMPNFRKLWGKISTNVVPGNYTVQIQNSKNENIS